MTDNLAQKHGWSLVGPVAEDGSTRRYDRYEKNGGTAIFMTVYGDTPGHRLEDFISVGGWLKEIGLQTPEIYEYSETEILMQDFGDITMKKAIEGGADALRLYQKAQEGLEVLEHAGQCPLKLPRYYDGFVHEWRDLIARWYVPALREEDENEAFVQEYLYAWDLIERDLPKCPEGPLHMDYHVENLMVLDDGSIGVIDFQGAMIGPKPYDLVNLCEDMRFDVPQDIQTELVKHKDEDFLMWYRVLGTQFHCRLVGQCVRWALRDNKPHYMQYMPRLFGYMNKALEHPGLGPLKAFFDKHNISFDEVPVLHFQKA